MRTVDPHQPEYPRIAEIGRSVRPSGDPAYHAMPLLRRLADALPAGIRFHDACHLEIERDLAARGGRVAFLNEPSLRVDPPIPQSIAEQVAARSPDLAQVWTVLPDQIDDAVTLMAASPLVRRAARAIPGFRDHATAFADRHPCGRHLADILGMPEDETVLVIDPIKMTGLRVRVRAIATVAEFHMLLAEIWPDGPKPHRSVIAAYHQLTLGDAPIATARFQLLHPRALRPDGTIPSGFDSSDDWIWNDRPLNTLPRIGFERTVIVTDPVYPATWEAVRTLPFPVEKLDVIDRLDEAAVRDWLRMAGASSELPSTPQRRAA